MRVLRFFSLFFTALSAGLVLSHVLEMRAKMRMEPNDYRKAESLSENWSLLGTILESGALIATLPLLLFGRRRGQDRTATLAGLAALGASEALWASHSQVGEQVSTMDSEGEHVGEWQEVRKRWEMSHAARAALQMGALGALLIASRDPEPRLKDAIKPEAQRLRKKAEKRFPKATSRAEDAFELIQPVAQRILQEVSKHAPDSASDARGKASDLIDDARDKASDLIDDARPRAMRFLHRAEDKSPVSAKDARKAVERARHRAPKQGRRFLHLLRAS